MIAALGGKDNLLEIDACTTRLRLRIGSQELIDEAALKSLGAAGVLRPTKDTFQVVMGLRADEIAGNMQAAIGKAGAELAASGERSSSTAPEVAQSTISMTPELITALGGDDNIIESEGFNSRLSVLLKDASVVSEAAVISAGYRGLAKLGEGRVQVLA